MQPLSCALIQTATHWHDPEANRRMFGELIAEVEPSTDIVVLPEMFSTGFTMSSAEVAEPMSGPTVAWMRALAAERGMVICGSSKYPSALTSCPCAFLVKEPSRVYAIFAPCVTRKNPSPSMAILVSIPVSVGVPCEKIPVVPTARTPLPI